MRDVQLGLYLSVRDVVWLAQVGGGLSGIELEEAVQLDLTFGIELAVVGKEHDEQSGVMLLFGSEGLRLHTRAAWEHVQGWGRE